MRTIYCFGALIGLLACQISARAAGAPLALLSAATVDGESIYLSDLLPARVSPELRDRAGKIRVATAPQPGGDSVLEGESIARLIKQQTDPREINLRKIEVPSEIAVRREGRLIEREEVLAAIRAALLSSNLPGGLSPQLSDVHFSVPVRISAVDAKLEVRRMDFDPALQQARFLLVSGADRRVLPFLVTARLPGPDSGSSSGGAIGLKRVSASSLPGKDEVPLVEPGKAASLRVFSGTMQMLLDVVPLDRGALHQTVRVRLRGTDKLLRGRVVAPGRLEARL